MYTLEKFREGKSRNVFQHKASESFQAAAVLTQYKLLESFWYLYFAERVQVSRNLKK